MELQVEHMYTNLVDRDVIHGQQLTFYLQFFFFFC